MTVVKTRAVAGAARRVKGSGKDNLTHAVAYDEPPPNASGHSPHVLCERVKEENVLDDPCATDEDAPPTCPTCLKKDPRGAPPGREATASHDAVTIVHRFEGDTMVVAERNGAFALIRAFSGADGVTYEGASAMGDGMFCKGWSLEDVGREALRVQSYTTLAGAKRAYRRRRSG